VYDPQDSFKFVRSITLLKNSFGDPFVKKGNDAETTMSMRWACNGEYLILVYLGKIRFFSLRTGIKIAKTAWLTAPSHAWVQQTFYDVDRNRFVSFGAGDERINKVMLWSIPNLKHPPKKDSASFSEFQKVFMRRENAETKPDLARQLLLGLNSGELRRRGNDQFISFEDLKLDDEASVRRQS
jgi:hypothetical protein